MPPHHHGVPGAWHRQSGEDVRQEITGRHRGQFPLQLRDDQLLPPLQQQIIRLTARQTLFLLYARSTKKKDRIQQTRQSSAGSSLDSIFLVTRYYKYDRGIKGNVARIERILLHSRLFYTKSRRMNST